MNTLLTVSIRLLLCAMRLRPALERSSFTVLVPARANVVDDIATVTGFAFGERCGPAGVAYQVSASLPADGELNVNANCPLRRSEARRTRCCARPSWNVSAARICA